MGNYTAEGLTVYGRNRNGDGGRNVSIVVEGMTVLIQSDDASSDEKAIEVARALKHRGDLLAEAQKLRAEHAEEVAALKRWNEELRVKAAAATASLHAVAEGRRRFFGPVLCVPTTAGDWSGSVWLLDPEKGERGSGLRFASLSELRELHPELWIVSVTDRGILLDAAKLSPPSAAQGKEPQSRSIAARRGRPPAGPHSRVAGQGPLVAHLRPVRRPVMPTLKLTEKAPMNARFPIQGGLTISWAAAEEAYRGYSRLYGTSQTLECIADRGGFGLMEFVCLVFAARAPSQGLALDILRCRPSDAHYTEALAAADVKAA